MQRAFFRSALVLLVLAGALYVAAGGYLYLFQRDYVFRPGGELAEPAALELAPIEIVTIEPEEGVTLTGWYAEGEPGRPTLLYFHGNAGNMSDRADRFEEVLASGFGLLAVSYRGYPGSGGSPSEAALFADALETFDWLSDRTERIVVHGESLGTGIAAYVAAEREAEALILEAPYTAALDIAAAAYPWLPAGWLMLDPFLSREHIARVDEPVLIAHGTADRVIPVQHGRELFEVTGEPKELWIVDGAGHSDLWRRGLWPRVLGFLRASGAAG